MVAIKLVAPHLAANPSARKRFDREAKAVAAVRDDHVVAIHAVEPNKPTPYLVMEFIGGVSLQEGLEQSGPFEVKEILRIGMQTASGLAAAHAQGLIHRDIKPANILLANGIERVKITDFGLARAVNDANLTQSGVITGTPNYMSSEQADGRTVDARSDLFSLGSVLYALAAGYPPFRADGLAAVLKRVAADTPRPVREINADVPDWLEAILQKLHAKNPAERFQMAKEVAELLGQHLAHLQQPGQAPLPPSVERPSAVSPEPKAPPSPAGATQPAAPPPFSRTITITFLHFAWVIVIFSVVFGELVFLLELLDNPTSPAIWTVISAVVAPLSAIGFYFSSRRDQRRRAAASAPVHRDAAVDPPTPPRDGWTAFALGYGFFTLAVGYHASLYLNEYQWLRRGLGGGLRAQASLMLLYAIPALLAFGPGVLLARRRWRRRFGPDRWGTPAPPSWRDSGSLARPWRSSSRSTVSRMPGTIYSAAGP